MQFAFGPTQHPYVNSVREHVPDADGKIVFDKFHRAKPLREAVDQVRRSENTVPRKAGHDRLAGNQYDWLKRPANTEPDNAAMGRAADHFTLPVQSAPASGSTRPLHCLSTLEFHY